MILTVGSALRYGDRRLAADEAVGLCVRAMPSVLGLCRGSRCHTPLPSALATDGQTHALPTTHCLPGAPEREPVRKAAGGVETINSQLLSLPRIVKKAA